MFLSLFNRFGQASCVTICFGESHVIMGGCYVTADSIWRIVDKNSQAKKITPGGLSNKAMKYKNCHVANLFCMN